MLLEASNIVFSLDISYFSLSNPENSKSSNLTSFASVFPGFGFVYLVIIFLASSLINFWWSIIFSFLKPSTINFLLIVLLVALDFNWIVNSIDVSLCFLILNIDVSYLFLSILLILIKLLKFESFIASLTVWLFLYSFETSIFALLIICSKFSSLVFFSHLHEIAKNGVENNGIKVNNNLFFFISIYPYILNYI